MVWGILLIFKWLGESIRSSSKGSVCQLYFYVCFISDSNIETQRAMMKDKLGRCCICLSSRFYTRFIVKKALDAGSGWIYATNLCYHKKSKKYHIFSLTGNPINIRAHGKQCHSSVPLSCLVFRYGWSFQYHKGRVPKEDVEWIDNPVYIAMQYRPKHITHFAESINLLLLKLLAPYEFPPVCNCVHVYM